MHVFWVGQVNGLFSRTFCFFSWIIVASLFQLQDSDDEAPKEEEKIATDMQREKAKGLTMEDFGLGDIDNDNLTSKVSSA